MRRRGFGGAIGTLLFIVIFGGITGYMLTSDDFERNAPMIGIKDKVYWNLRSPMSIKFKDDKGVNFF